MFKFITLTNGKKVQAFYEADEEQVSKIVGSKFDFKELTDGKIVQKIAFVDADGNKINIFKIPTDNLEAYYPFNNNVLDESGNLHHGVNTDATFITDRNGNVNSAIRFDGVTANVVISDLILKQATQSLCLWIKWRAGVRLVIGLGANTNRYYIFNTTVTRGTNINHTYSANIIDGNWHFIIKEWDDDSNLKVWIDNVLDIDTTYTKVASGGDAGIALASNALGIAPYSDIDLDDIRVYNRRLTSLERTALFLEQ